jgi:acyl-coenzyme A synthetase/AMP-(fatty) acid ligase
VTGLRDLVPVALRRRWVRVGWCPGRDLYRLFRDHTRAHPDRPAVLDDAGAVDYATLHAQVRRTATDWSRAGLGPGDVIGIRLPAGRDAVAAELAVWALGATALVDPGWPDLLGRARAAALVTEPFARVGLVHQLTVPPWDSCLVPDWAAPRTDPDTAARILVTAGRCGEPKLVAYSHNALAGGHGAVLRALAGGAAPRVCVPTGSPLAVPVTVAALGGTLVPQPEPAELPGLLVEHCPTHLLATPAVLRALAASGVDLPVPEVLAATGGQLSDVDISTGRRTFRRTPLSLYHSVDGLLCHDGTVPDPAVAEVRVVDQDGEPVPPGVSGEVCALGPMTPLGYVTDTEAAGRCRLPGGWARTADLGALDTAGRLHLLGHLTALPSPRRPSTPLSSRR